MTADPPTTFTQKAHTRASSLVLVNTGDGKGKTTAAMGVVLRGIGRGWKISVVQFLKSGKWHSGEVEQLQNLGVQWRFGGDGFTWIVDDLERSKALAQDAWSTARAEISSGEFELVLLDEVTYPMNYGWIALEDVVDAIKERPKHVNVIATGRDAPGALIEVADTVTEMRKIQHAYDAGFRAKRGIDY